MGRWVAKTEFRLATDVGMAVELARPGSASGQAAVQLLAPLAADIIKNDETIIETTREAVADRVAAENLVKGDSTRLLPSEELVSFGPMAPSSGYSWGIVLQAANGRRYVALGVKLNGDVGGRFAGSSGAGNVLATVRDIIYGWWSGPVVETVTGFYATAGLGRAGDSMAIDIDFHGVVSAARIGLNGMVGVDDHNPPSRKTIRDVATGYVRGGIAQLKNHGTETTFRVVSAPGRGRAVDFIGRPEVTVPIGSAVSYGAWIHNRYAQTATTDDLMLLLRNDANWGIRDMRVDWASDGAVTQLGAYKRLLSFAQQPYVTPADGVPTADGHQTVRLAAGYNPTGANRHEVYLLSFDVQTGDVRDIKTGNVLHNIYTSAGYLSDASLTPAIPDVATGTRRLLDARPASAGVNWGVLTVEYPGEVGPDGVITEWEFSDAGVLLTKREWGKTGQHLERYPGGAKFGPDGAVWHVNEAGGTFTLSRNGVPVRKSTTALFRPMPAPTGGPAAVFVNEVKGYNDYLDWFNSILLVLSQEALK